MNNSEIKAAVTNAIENALEGIHTRKEIGNVVLNTNRRSGNDKIQLTLHRLGDEETIENLIYGKFEYLGSEKRYNDAVDRATEAILNNQ